MFSGPVWVARSAWPRPWTASWWRSQTVWPTSDRARTAHLSRGGETSPPGVVRRDRVLEVDVRHKPGGDDQVTTGCEPSQRSGHSIVKKKTHNRNTRNTGLLLNKWETQLLKVVSFFTWTKQVHICETVSRRNNWVVMWPSRASAAQSPPQSLLFSSNVPSETWGLFLLTQAG